jgi:hypothetical protein
MRASADICRDILVTCKAARTSYGTSLPHKNRDVHADMTAYQKQWRTKLHLLRRKNGCAPVVSASGATALTNGCTRFHYASFIYTGCSALIASIPACIYPHIISNWLFFFTLIHAAAACSSFQLFAVCMQKQNRVPSTNSCIIKTFSTRSCH